MLSWPIFLFSLTIQVRIDPNRLSIDEWVWQTNKQTKTLSRNPSQLTCNNRKQPQQWTSSLHQQRKTASKNRVRGMQREEIFTQRYHVRARIHASNSAEGSKACAHRKERHIICLSFHLRSTLGGGLPQWSMYTNTHAHTLHSQEEVNNKGS
jgi:hypothetical protein